MIRIIMPLAIVAAMYFGPMFSETISGSATGDRVAMVTGEHFIGNAIDCMINLEVPLAEECASDGEIAGSKQVGEILSWVAIIAVAAGALGIVGILPFIGRLTSVVTLLAGIAGVGGLGLFALTIMGTDEGLAGLQWGAYLAGGASLLTLISGLSGMRGR